METVGTVVASVELEVAATAPHKPLQCVPAVHHQPHQQAFMQQLSPSRFLMMESMMPGSPDEPLMENPLLGSSPSVGADILASSPSERERASSPSMPSSASECCSVCGDFGPKVKLVQRNQMCRACNQFWKRYEEKALARNAHTNPINATDVLQGGKKECKKDCPECKRLRADQCRLVESTFPTKSASVRAIPRDAPYTPAKRQITSSLSSQFASASSYSSTASSPLASAPSSALVSSASTEFSFEDAHPVFDLNSSYHDSLFEDSMGYLPPTKTMRFEISDEDSSLSPSSYAPSPLPESPTGSLADATSVIGVLNPWDMFEADEHGFVNVQEDEARIHSPTVPESLSLLSLLSYEYAAPLRVPANAYTSLSNPFISERSSGWGLLSAPATTTSPASTALQGNHAAAHAAVAPTVSAAPATRPAASPLASQTAQAPLGATMAAASLRRPAPTISAASPTIAATVLSSATASTAAASAASSAVASAAAHISATTSGTAVSKQWSGQSLGAGRGMRGGLGLGANLPSSPLASAAAAVSASPATTAAAAGQYDCLIIHHHEESLESAWRVYTGLIERHVRCMYNRDMLKQASERRFASFLQSTRSVGALVVLATPRYLKALEAPESVCCKELAEAERAGRHIYLVLLDSAEASSAAELAVAAPHLAAVISGPLCAVVNGKERFTSAIDVVVSSIQSRTSQGTLTSTASATTTSAVPATFPNITSSVIPSPSAATSQGSTGL